AREAGVSVGVLYQRFKDKRGFFEIIVDALAEQLNSEIDEFFLAAEAAETAWDLPKLIERVVASLVAMVERDVGFFVALITIGDQVPGTLGKVAVVDRHRAQALHRYALANRLIDPAAVDEARIYFALATAIRMLLVTATVDREPIRLRDPSTLEGLAAMLTGYLQPPKT
ncbi:MAG: TetR/AcrR family transcriptional regulator, partial [Pseudomonadales bacterium]